MPTLAALLLCRPKPLSCQMLPYERNRTIVRSFPPRPRVPDSPDVQFDLQSLAKDAAALSDITPRSKMRRLGDDVASGCHRSENISSLKLITDTQAGRRAKVAGMSIDAHEQDLAKREIAALRLFEELPAHVLQELGWSGKQAVFDKLDPASLHSCVKAWSRGWSPGTLNGARCAWVRLRLWMQRMDSDDELPCVAVLQAFLDDIHAEAVKNELTRYRKSCDKAVLEHKPVPVRRRDGTRAALGVWDGLNFLRNRLHMPIPTNLVRDFLPNNAGSLPRRISTPAPPLPIRVLVDLETLISSSSCPPVMKNIAGAILFMAYGCHRFKQASSVQFYYFFDGCLCGQVNYDKGRAREPRPFFLPLEGLLLGSQWLKIFMGTLPDDGTYIVRDFSGAIDSFHATFLPAPLPDSKVESSLRFVIHKASPWLQPDSVKSFSRHSARHSLPCSAAARLTPFEYQVEIGRWSGALAYRRGLLATSTLNLKRAFQCMAMPSRYSMDAAACRAIHIMKAEMGAMREYVQRVGLKGLPPFGGWEHLRKYDPKTQS